MSTLTDAQDKLLNQVYYNENKVYGRDKLYRYLRDNHPDTPITRAQVMSWLRGQNQPTTEEQEKLLHNIYFKKKMYFGRDKLFQYLQDNHPHSGITIRQVQKWLDKQEVHQLYKQPKKTKNIQRTILSKPLSQVAIDLVDMQSYEHKQYKYILTAIDLFSKYAWAVPLRNKSAVTVKNGMLKVIRSIPKGDILSLRSDNGSEFISKQMKKLLSNYGIKQVLSLPHKPQSNGGIERFNKTLKTLIKKHKTQTDSADWVQVLPQLVSNYNTTFHRTIKTTPEKAFKGEDNETIKENTRKSVSDKNQKVKQPLLNVGDHVRLKLVKTTHQKTETLWTEKIFIIDKVNKPKSVMTKPFYYVKDKEGNRFRTRLYNEDLQVVKDMDTRIASVEKFVVSKINKHRKKKGKYEFLVSWVGYGPDDDSWEPEENLMKDVPKIVKKYKQEHKLN